METYSFFPLEIPPPFFVLSPCPSFTRKLKPIKTPCLFIVLDYNFYVFGCAEGEGVLFCRVVVKEDFKKMYGGGATPDLVSPSLLLFLLLPPFLRPLLWCPHCKEGTTKVMGTLLRVPYKCACVCSLNRRGEHFRFCFALLAETHFSYTKKRGANFRDFSSLSVEAHFYYF